MRDDVLFNKAATIERCVARAKEEFLAAGEFFATDFTRQDAAVLNVQRACEAALDMGQHLIRREKLGIPQSARDVFAVEPLTKPSEAALARRVTADSTSSTARSHNNARGFC
jgi:uncharacterized protein YutE (UPF0331/DUF86 family)